MLPLGGRYCFVLSVHLSQRFVWESPPIFYVGIPQNFAVLAYYHRNICISLWKFEQTIFEGVTAPFHLKYFIKKFVLVISS